MALVTTSSSTSSQAALEAEIEKIEAENTANYSSKVSTFLNEIIESAINGWTQYKILPSLTAAQAILESGWGTSTLASEYHNLFGIKGSYNGQTVDMPTEEYYSGAYHEIDDYFRVYASDSESITDYEELLSENSRYSNLIGETDAATAAEEIYEDGYATDPDYTEELEEIINEYNLTAWDSLAFKYSGTVVTTTGSTSTSTSSAASSASSVSSSSATSSSASSAASSASSVSSSSATSSSAQHHRVLVLPPVQLHLFLAAVQHHRVLVLQPVQLHLFLAAVQHHRVLVLPPVQLHLFLAAVQHHRVLVLPVVVQRRVLLRAIPSLLEIL